MRKSIIFGAIAALFGIVGAAQASDYAERTIKNGGQVTYADADDRHETAKHKMRARAGHGVRDRDDDAYEDGKEAREHRERHDRD